MYVVAEFTNPSWDLRNRFNGRKYFVVATWAIDTGISVVTLTPMPMKEASAFAKGLNDAEDLLGS